MPNEHQTPKKRLSTSVSEVRQKKEVVLAYRCNICKIEHDTDQDNELNSLWVRCSAPRCNYWVHTRCCNLKYSNNKRSQAKLDKWAKKHFYCARHFDIYDNSSSSESETSDEEVVDFLKRKGKGEKGRGKGGIRKGSILAKYAGKIKK